MSDVIATVAKGGRAGDFVKEPLFSVSAEAECAERGRSAWRDEASQDSSRDGRCGTQYFGCEHCRRQKPHAARSPKHPSRPQHRRLRLREFQKMLRSLVHPARSPKHPTWPQGRICLEADEERNLDLNEPDDALGYILFHWARQKPKASDRVIRFYAEEQHEKWGACVRFVAFRSVQLYMEVQCDGPRRFQ